MQQVAGLLSCFKTAGCINILKATPGSFQMGTAQNLRKTSWILMTAYFFVSARSGKNSILRFLFFLLFFLAIEADFAENS